MTKKEGFSKKERKEVTKGMEVKEETRVAPGEFEGTLDFDFEVNTLKTTRSAGWRLAGIPESRQDSVASHAEMVAQYTYPLARMEGLGKEEALKCVGLAVFHDNPETRIGDIDKLMARYLDMETIITETYPIIIVEQTSQLPSKIAEEISDLIRESNLGESREAIIVRDADILERAVQSKVYAEGGYKLVRDFFDEKEERKLKTETARKLMSLIRQGRNLATRWRRGLKVE